MKICLLLAVIAKCAFVSGARVPNHNSGVSVDNPLYGFDLDDFEDASDIIDKGIRTPYLDPWFEDASDIIDKGIRTPYLDPFLQLLINSVIEVIADGIPELGIPGMDPLVIENVNLNIAQPALRVQGSISNIHASGLRSLKLSNLETDLPKYKSDVTMDLGGMTISGEYDIDGMALLIFPIYGKGPFEITISSLSFSGGSQLVMAGPYLQLNSSLYDISIGNFNAKFEGLLGGGDLGDTLNEIINIIGLSIFDLIKPSIHDSLVLATHRYVNSELMQVTLEDIMNGKIPEMSANSKIMKPVLTMADAGPYVDEVLANLRHEMIMNDLDRIVLPDSVLGFSQKILGIVWHGEASIYNGLVLGLATIHRSGPANLNVENGDIVFDAELEINDGTLFADMKVKFMNLGPQAKITGTLKRIKIGIKCRIAGGLDKVTLETFNLKDLGYLSVDISGLGLVLNFLIEIVSEFIGNLVKGLVAFFLEGSLKTLLNDVISKTLFPELISAKCIPWLTENNEKVYLKCLKFEAD